MNLVIAKWLKVNNGTWAKGLEPVRKVLINVSAIINYDGELNNVSLVYKV